MSDHGSPHPPRSGPVAAAIVLGILFMSFAGWWFVTSEAEPVQATPTAAVSDSLQR